MTRFGLATPRDTRCPETDDTSPRSPAGDHGDDKGLLRARSPTGRRGQSPNRFASITRTAITYNKPNFSRARLRRAVGWGGRGKGAEVQDFRDRALATRNPTSKLRFVGWLQRRSAERQRRGLMRQDPPRNTRAEVAFFAPPYFF